MSDFITDLNSLLDNNEFEKLNYRIQESSLKEEPYLIQLIPELLTKLTDFKTSEQAKETGDLIIGKTEYSV